MKALILHPFFVMVPLFDLTRQYQSLRTELDAAVLELLASGHYVLGEAVENFEKSAADALGTRHAIGVANGTDALHIALQAMGLKRGGEIITTPFSFIATAEVAAYFDAKPVFVDIEPDTFNLDVAQIEAAITPQTKAIVPVHLFGHPANMDEINAIAARHNLPVLEDAAQAWGAKLGGQNCGNLGLAGAFSFFPSKNLGACGEGGLISTNDDEIAEKCRMLRVHGQRRRYIHDEIGYNSRLHSMQAAILNVKLPHAQKWNDARRANAARYRELLGDLPIVLPVEKDGAHHVYHQYTVRVPEESMDRDVLCQELTEREIGWAIYYPMPLHVQPVFEKFGYQEGQFPHAERASREVLSLPIFPELRADELEQVVAGVRAGCQRALR